VENFITAKQKIVQYLIKEYLKLLHMLLCRPCSLTTVGQR